MREVNYDERWKAARDLSCKINLWPTVENLQHIDAALRRAKAEVSLVWTEEPPETPGKYWWRLHSDYEPEIMSVLAYADGTAMRPCDYGHWAGPIALPLDARAAQIEEGE